MNIVERVKNILLSPAKEWEKIKGETTPIADLFTKYAMILAAIPALAGFMGLFVIGVGNSAYHFRWPFGSAFTWMILNYVFYLAGVFAMGFIIDALAPSFGATKDLPASMRVAVYSMTAFWIAGVFLIVFSISVLAIIVGLYSVFLFYLGIQKVKAPPPDKLMGYFIVSVLVAGAVMAVAIVLVNNLALRRAVGFGY